ncbi:hypothetical protein BN1048_01881 [Jeotgalicoccus saudimassiliensis]|uniref:Acyltransferase family protein n=1 Tax=Jeotgalicoccus saudimassiliensis TaxID=1461582 RepID=A0A078M9G5_9STAP|nr:hypothetical protein BN1048_01881 [Jeotgalicoccus saudimassiliensis]
MSRMPFFDNARLILIFLVVFGHMIQPFASDSQLINSIYAFIYIPYANVYNAGRLFSPKASVNRTISEGKTERDLNVSLSSFSVGFTLFKGDKSMLLSGA